jgi:Protein of unknown function (DUF3253)
MPTSQAITHSNPTFATHPNAPAGCNAGDSVAIENAIFELLAKRQQGASICPSDAARAVYRDAARWREAMPLVRAVAAQLALSGRLVITQGGQAIDLCKAVGPIRLRLPKPWRDASKYGGSAG